MRCGSTEAGGWGASVPTYLTLYMFSEIHWLKSYLDFNEILAKIRFQTKYRKCSQTVRHTTVIFFLKVAQ